MVAIITDESGSRSVATHAAPTSTATACVSA